MEYKINNEDRTITIFDSDGRVDEIKTLLETFPGYSLKTGTQKKRMCL